LQEIKISGLKNVGNFLKRFPNTASSEQVRQERGSRFASSRYQYLMLVNSSNITEYRTDSKGKPADLGGVDKGFALKMLRRFGCREW